MSARDEFRTCPDCGRLLLGSMPHECVTCEYCGIDLRVDPNHSEASCPECDAS